jgi:RNA polymerase sigma-70 factor, ECF subfamily
VTGAEPRKFPNVEERELIRRAKRGDRFAFQLLAEQHQAKLFTLAARQLGSHADAADVVQETLLRAWLALPRFRGEAQLSTWLYRIAMNAIHDQRARARPAGELPETLHDPRDRVAQAELSEDLQRALDSLEPDFKAAVVLVDVLGVPYSEAAEALDVAEGTVKSRVFRGRRELARMLEGRTQ